MSSVIILPYFRKQLKKLAKKYPSLKKELVDILKNFDKSKNISLGKNLYKIRISPKELKKGKSKSLRLIILLVEADSLIVPITIFAKSNTQNITRKNIDKHLDGILAELEV